MTYSDEQKVRFLTGLIARRLGRECAVRVGLGGYTDEPQYRLVISFRGTGMFDTKFITGRETRDVQLVFSKFLEGYFSRLEYCLEDGSESSREFVADFAAVGSHEELELLMEAASA